MKFKSNYNAIKNPKEYYIAEEVETSIQPDMAVPDQSMSVIEIMRRFANGQPLGGTRNPVWNGEDTEIPANWDQMDISEQEDYKQANFERIKELNQDLYDQNNKLGKYKPEDIQQPAPSAGSKDTNNPKDTTQSK